jgi:hypothetical protein
VTTKLAEKVSEFKLATSSEVKAKVSTNSEMPKSWIRYREIDARIVLMFTPTMDIILQNAQRKAEWVYEDVPCCSRTTS